MTEPAETSPREEIAVIRRIVTALDGLDPRTRARVVAYLADRFTPAVSTPQETS